MDGKSHGKNQRGDRPLSTVGIAALRRLTSLISDIPEVRDACSPKEIAEEVFERYSTWVLSTRQPSGQEFTDDVLRALRAKVKVHELVISIEGIDIVDQEAIDLGSMRICKADRRLLEGVKLGGILTPDWVYGLFQDKLWLAGKSEGSPAVALRKFEHRAALTVGLLAVCGALLFKGAIWRSHARLASSPSSRAAWSILCWEQRGAEPRLINSSEGTQSLPLSAESIAYLRRDCFLDQIMALLHEAADRGSGCDCPRVVLVRRRPRRPKSRHAVHQAVDLRRMFLRHRGDRDHRGEYPRNRHALDLRRLRRRRAASGANPDVLGCFSELVVQEPAALMILSSASTSPLSSRAEKHWFTEYFGFDSPFEGEGFVATNSILAQVILMKRAYEAAFNAPGESVIQNLEDAATADWLTDLQVSLERLGTKRHLLVLFGELGRPAALGLESKFSEVGLASVQLADFRNFAHGRHNWLDKHPDDTLVVSIEIGHEATLATRTLRLLPTAIPILRLTTRQDSHVGSIIAILAVMKLTGVFGLMKGLDPGRPGVPSYGSGMPERVRSSLAYLDSGLLEIKRHT